MRDAPAFQEYAAAMLANSRYRLMSLAERGLLDTLRRECWVNRGMPAKPATLAKMLGFDSAEIDAAPVSLLQDKLREAIESVIDVHEFYAQIALEKEDAANVEAHRRVVFDAIGRGTCDAT